MVLKSSLVKKWESEFEKGTSLSKCQKCGCMIGALEEMKTSLSSVKNKEAKELLKKIESWLGKMESSLYT
jgi:hypothetical protein